MASFTGSQYSTPRRYITHHDKNGIALVSARSDEVARPFGDGSFGFPLWSASQSPADNSDRGSQQPADISTAFNGSFFTAYDLPPGYEGPLHRSTTLDYVLVYKGIIVLTMDGGSRVTLVEGDTIIQRGTMHKWSNEGDQWARMMTVMVAAMPVVATDGTELQMHWPF